MAERPEPVALGLAAIVTAGAVFFRFGVAGLSSRWRIKIGAFGTAAGVFLVALLVLATV